MSETTEKLAIRLLLGLTNLPPTVLRRIRGQVGSLQVWVEGAVTQKNLDEKQFRSEMKGLLRPAEISDLLRRRDEIVSQLGSTCVPDSNCHLVATGAHRKNTPSSAFRQ
jgi:hypothetical protein